MATSTDQQLNRVTPVELVDAVRSGRIRYPSPGTPSADDVGRIIDGIQRRYPQRPLLLWRDPSDDRDPAPWLLDGGDLVSALLRVTDTTPRRPSPEPLFLDTDTGEIVTWGQRPDRRHVVLDVEAILAAENLDIYLSSEHLAGPRADRVRAFDRSLREHSVPVEVVDLPRSELPRLFRYLRGRSGVSLFDLNPLPEPSSGPDARFFAWTDRPRSLISAAHGDLGFQVAEEDLWRALLAAEGRDPDLPYDESAESTDLPDGGRLAVAAVRNAQSFLRGVIAYPSGDLLPETTSLAVVARFLRVFPDVERPVWPLLRRWVWRSALAGRHVDLSPLALSVIREDAGQSAVRLLEGTPIPTLAAPGRSELDLTGRLGKQVVLGLASLHPRDLPTGLLIDIERSKPRVILPQRGTEAANLMIHDYPWRSGHRTLSEVLEAATDAAVLSSHGIDEVAVDLLRGGDEEAFLARRSAALDRAVLGFWTAMVEPSARTRRPVALLFEDDDGA